jgi:rhamnosyltransferase
LNALNRQHITVLRNDNLGGLAGAYNTALAWIAEYQRDVTHVLFIDDDSDLSALDAFLRSEATREVATYPSVAAVAPVYRDKRTGLRGRHIQLSRFHYRFLPREQTTPVDVAFIINSMSLWRFDVLTRLGPYSVALGIDHIDTEYALRAKRAGFRIVLNAGVEFLHEIGERRSYKLFGKMVQSGGHSADRRFLIGRNTVIVAKKHGIAYPAFMFLCLQRLGYESLGILIAEDSKAAKLSGLWRGALRGLVTRA